MLVAGKHFCQAADIHLVAKGLALRERLALVLLVDEVFPCGRSLGAHLHTATGARQIRRRLTNNRICKLPAVSRVAARLGLTRQ